MWKLALRNVLRHKGRTGMTLSAIIVGVVGLILSGGFVQDIFLQLGETLIHSQSGHLQLSRSGYFDRGARSPEKYLISDSESLRQSIMKMTEVDEAMGRIYFSGLLNNGRSELPIVGEGIEPDRENRLGRALVVTAGRKLEDKDASGIMIGHGLARALLLKPGDRATLVLNTPDGALNSLEFTVVGVFQTFSKDYDARAVRIPLTAAQEIQATSGINTIVVALKRTQDTNRVVAAMKHQFSAADIEVKSWIELNDFYTKTVGMYDAQFGVLRIIILVMVLLSVSNSVNMSVFERVGEFGTMMALGNRGSRVFALIVTENAIIGFGGAILGIVLGVILALLISAVGIPMPPPPDSDLGYTAHILIVPSVIVGAFIVGFIATLAAAVLPASKVRRIPVVDALRQSI